MFHKNVYKNVIVPLILASLVFTAVNTAIANPTEELVSLEQEGTRNEALGFFGGALLGGLVAGPPGAIASAMFGLISTSSNSEQNEKTLLSGHLDQSQQELIALQSQQRDLERRYQIALQELEYTNLQRVSLTNQISTGQDNLACCRDTALSMHFTTNSAAIEQHYMDSLQELVLVAETLGGPLIIVSGYADARGTSMDNQRLSEQRVDTVVRTLLAMGINPEGIQSTAFGESRTLSQGDNVETLFFDRRVNVVLRSANNELFTLSE
ncbi:MAG: OmpA family protein [Gammaproteobacteria bacterium]|jgi:sortase system peptidoglycan-associated protein|nr:OmpA family protein [Gammaproteobacteria bacterium]